MAKNDPRVSVTVSSDAHRALLEWWAALTGRSVPNLVSFLLEKAIVDALRNGEVPQRAVACMDHLMDAREQFLADEWQEAVSLVEQSGSL